jgi:hypothetical protein
MSNTAKWKTDHKLGPVFELIGYIFDFNRFAPQNQAQSTKQREKRCSIKN